jgi:thiol:disulfide interchange protein
MTEPASRMTRSAKRTWARNGVMPAALAAFFICFTEPAAAQTAQPQGNPFVDVRLLASAAGIQPGGKVRLAVVVEPKKGWHIYWRYGGASGLPTTVDWELPAGWTVSELEYPVPDVLDVPEVGINYIYHGRTVLLATLSAPADAAPGSEVKIAGAVRFLVCDADKCMPGREPVELSLPIVAQAPQPANADLFEQAEQALPIAASKAENLKISTYWSQDAVRPGDNLALAVVLDVEQGYHIQSHQPITEGLIATDLWTVPIDGADLGEPVFPPARVRDVPVLGKVSEYHGRVVIRIPIEAFDDLAGETINFYGLLTYQACSDQGNCFPPVHVAISASLPVRAKDALVKQTSTDIFGAAEAGGFDLKGNVQPVGLIKGRSWWVYLLLALVGGLILNVMPCVLPVISIKVLSFAQQAGESRGRVMALNLIFCLGVMSIFWVFAVLAISAGFGWGDLFKSTTFLIVMAAIVFAFALSLFGVFDIPVPGFVNKAGAGLEREGLTGAFLKGVLATLLATPCLGPFVGPALTWSLSQPALLVVLIWTCLGLGMCSPYLLLAAKPSWIRFLPKPGAWMETFKQAMAFLLVGTVVFLLRAVPAKDMIATLALLTAVGLGCWMLGRFAAYGTGGVRKIVVLLIAVAVIWGTTRVAYSREQAAELPWQPFTVAALGEYTAAGKTVLVDFTADWCLNCKWNEATALNISSTRKLVDDLGVVCLLADFTNEDPDIRQVMEKLGNTAVPLTAIFPAGRPNEPILIDGTYTPGTLRKRLREAGPSKGE